MRARRHTIGGSSKLLPLRQAADYIGVPVRTFEKHWRGWGLPAAVLPDGTVRGGQCFGCYERERHPEQAALNDLELLLAG